MKKLSLIMLLFTAYFLSGCKSGNPSNPPVGTKESDAVCVWDNISLKETPAENGKWLSAISIGEKIMFLDEIKEDSTGKKKVKYYKIQLKDNKTGWVQSDFIVLKSKPAVISSKVEVYSRPDLLTRTGKNYDAMDIVAVSSEQNGFIEVNGKRKDGKWIETGWIKSNGVSYADIDIAVAKYARKALEIKDNNKRIEAIKEIKDNPDFKASIFISTLKSAQAEAEEVNLDSIPKAE